MEASNGGQVPEGNPVRGTARAWPMLLLSVAAGAAVSVQSFVNGRLGHAVGSAVAAAAVNNGSALILMAAAAVLTGALPRAWKEVRSQRRPVRIWWFFGGLIGASAVYVNALAAPALGIAFLTVALVLGQLTGSLLADALGLAPAGRQTLSLRRLAGASCALAGVGIGALGQGGHLLPALLAFVIAAGAAVAFQQAGNAQLVRLTGEPVAMGLLNFVVGASLLLAVLALTSAGTAPLAQIPGWGWVGGALGAGIAVFGALAAKACGVLKLMLGLVAGQSLMSLVLDAAAPAAGRPLTWASVAGVVLACAAVVVTNWPARRAAALQTSRPRIPDATNHQPEGQTCSRTPSSSA